MTKRFFLIASSFLFMMSINFSTAQKIFDQIEKGNIKAVKKWLENDAFLDETYEQVNEEGDILEFHPLTWAAIHNQKEIIKLMVKNKSKFDDFDKWATKALGGSIQHGDTNIVNLLLDNGADIQSPCEFCREAVPIAISVSYRHYDVMNLLLRRGAKLKNYYSGYDVIHVAVKTDSLEFIKEMVEVNGLDVNKLSRQGMFPIHYAMQQGNIEVLDYLLSKGADIYALDEKGNSIFYFTSKIETFRWAEDKIKDPKKLIEDSNPIIQLIIEEDDKRLFDYFIEKYANEIHRIDSEDGTNAYFGLLLTEKNTTHFYKMLKMRNVKLIDNDDGESVAQYAKWMKRKKLKKLLKMEYESIR